MKNRAAIKSVPPASRLRLIARDRLSGVICSGLGAPLVLVRAPAGYGKTTLLAQWWQGLTAQHRRVAWVNADARDSDPLHLLAAINQSIERSGIEPRRCQAFNDGADCEDSLALRFEWLAERIERGGECVHLFIDNYQHCDGPRCGDLLVRMLANMPTSLRVILATRQEPDLPLSLMRSRAQLIRFGIQELRFTDAEASDMLSSNMLAQHAGEIVRIADGWPAVLQLLRFRDGANPGPSSLTDHPQACPLEVAAYITEQIFDALSAVDQEFLLCASVLEQLQGDLVNRLTGRSDGWATLDRLSKLNLPVWAVDQIGERYQLHPLLAAYLAQKLVRAAPERVPFLHARAADWYHARGRQREAVSHAVAAGDLHYAAKIIERAGGWHLAHREGRSGVRSYDGVPAALALQFPQLRLGQIYLLAQYGRLQEARRMLEELRQSTSQFQVLRPGLDCEEFQLDVFNVESCLDLYEDRPPQIADVERVHARANAARQRSPSTNFGCLSILCCTCVVRAQFEDAVALGLRYTDDVTRYGAPYLYTYMLTWVGIGFFALGELRQGLAFEDRAAAEAAAKFGALSNQHIAAMALRAEMLLELGREEESRSSLLQAGKLCDSDGSVEYYAAADLTEAALAGRRGNLEEALALLSTARARAIRCGLKRLEVIIALQCVRELIRAGRVRSAHTLLDEEPAFALLSSDISLEDRHRQNRVRYWTLAGWIAMHESDYERAEHCRCRAQEVWESSTKTGIPYRHRVEVAALHAAICFQTGKQDADEIARSALVPALERGYFGVFVDQGQFAAPLIARAVASGAITDATLPSCLRSSTAGSQCSHTNTLVSGRLHFRMSAREADILQFLADGFSSKEIARALGIAVSTVQTHRRNLYKKLGVTTRSQAIIRTLGRRIEKAARV